MNINESFEAALGKLASGVKLGPDKPKPPPPPPQAKTYLLTSDKFDGAVLFEFDADGFLIRYDISEAQLDERQRLWILQKLPKAVEHLKLILKAARGARLTLQARTGVPFEDFWDRYDHKALSSKKKCLAWWKRSSKLQRDRAYNFIGLYEKRLPDGIAKKYAETYLNSELWNN